MVFDALVINRVKISNKVEESRLPFIKYDFWLKTTFDRRLCLTEDTFNGRWPLMEDELWGQPLTKDKSFCYDKTKEPKMLWFKVPLVLL